VRQIPPASVASDTSTVLAHQSHDLRDDRVTQLFQVFS